MPYPDLHWAGWNCGACVQLLTSQAVRMRKLYSRKFMASVKRRCCGVCWTPGARSWWLSTCPDLRAQGAWLGKFWVLLPQLVRLDYCWVALWGVSCLLALPLWATWWRRMWQLLNMTTTKVAASHSRVLILTRPWKASLSEVFNWHGPRVLRDWYCGYMYQGKEKATMAILASNDGWP